MNTAAKSHKLWIPSSMQRTCLTHLDRPGSWSLLRVDPPEMTERIRWRHVRRIFRFNFLVFGVVFAGLMTLMAVGAGYARSEFVEDLPYLLGVTVVIASGMALYVADLYRRSWNNRARHLSQDER